MNKLTLKQIAFAFFVSSVFFLSGCVGMGSKFDCNVGSGGKCMPMSHINKMANQGAFNESSIYGVKDNAITKVESKIFQGNGYLLNAFTKTPIRSSERIQQIWIGPYEDTNGIYHEPSFVCVVVKKGRWIGKPAQVIQE